MVWTRQWPTSSGHPEATHHHPTAQAKANRVAAKKPPPLRMAAWSVARLLRYAVGPLAGRPLGGFDG
jgi:hypothetical protein